MSICATTAVRACSLTRQGDALPVIPLRPGLFERLTLGGGNIVGNLEKISGQLAVLLNDDNVRALQSALQDAATVSASLKDASAQLGPLVGKVGPLVDSLTETSRQAQGTARDLSALAQQARVAVARLDAPDGPLIMATRMPARNRLCGFAPVHRDPAGRQRHGEPGQRHRARRVGGGAPGRRYARNRLYFGAPPPRPGPGEAGFEGFGRGQ